MKKYDRENYFKAWTNMFDRTLQDTKLTFGHLESKLNLEEKGLLRERLDETPFQYGSIGSISTALYPSLFLKSFEYLVDDPSCVDNHSEACWNRFGGVSTEHTKNASLACEVLSYYVKIFSDMNLEGTDSNLKELDKFSKLALNSFEGLSAVLRQGYHMKPNVPSTFMSPVIKSFYDLFRMNKEY